MKLIYDSNCSSKLFQHISFRVTLHARYLKLYIMYSLYSTLYSIFNTIYSKFEFLAFLKSEM